jgi:hypothetical protein
MIRRDAGAGRSTRHILAVASVILLVGGLTPAAEARVAASPSAPSVHVTQTDVSEFVCDLLGQPVSVAVNRLISWISRGRIRTTLAGDLFADIGFNPWCRSQYPKLERIVNDVVKKRPAFRPELGPFVFDLRASFETSTRYVGYDFVSVRWNVLPSSSRVNSFALWYRLNGGGWRRLRLPALNVARRDRVQFALQVRSAASGVWGPFAYSRTYY